MFANVSESQLPIPWEIISMYSETASVLCFLRITVYWWCSNSSDFSSFLQHCELWKECANKDKSETKPRQTKEYKWMTLFNQEIWLQVLLDNTLRLVYIKVIWLNRSWNIYGGGIWMLSFKSSVCIQKCHEIRWWPPEGYRSPWKLDWSVTMSHGGSLFKGRKATG